MSDYFELLKHPLWQKKRLEILQRYEFRCADCGANDITLHVHHRYYERGKKPWEYKDDCYLVLCETCHFKHTSVNKWIKNHIGCLPLERQRELIGYISFIILERYADEIDIVDEDYARGVAAALRLPINFRLPLMVHEIADLKALVTSTPVVEPIKKSGIRYFPGGLIDEDGVTWTL